MSSSPDKYQSRRELFSSSTEIFPLYKNDTIYGAIQNGAHRFYETIAGKEENFASSAKFSNVWLLENGQWKLTKSLSFDHQTSFDISNTISIFDNDKEIEKWLKSINIPALGIGVINSGKLQQVKPTNPRSYSRYLSITVTVTNKLYKNSNGNKTTDKTNYRNNINNL